MRERGNNLERKWERKEIRWSGNEVDRKWEERDRERRFGAWGLRREGRELSRRDCDDGWGLHPIDSRRRPKRERDGVGWGEGNGFLANQYAIIEVWEEMDSARGKSDGLLLLLMNATSDAPGASNLKKKKQGTHTNRKEKKRKRVAHLHVDTCSILEKKTNTHTGSGRLTLWRHHGVSYTSNYVKS